MVFSHLLSLRVHQHLFLHWMFQSAQQFMTTHFNVKVNMFLSIFHSAPIFRGSKEIIREKANQELLLS